MVAPLEMFSWSSVLIWNEGRMPNNFLWEAVLGRRSLTSTLMGCLASEKDRKGREEFLHLS